MAPPSRTRCGQRVLHDEKRPGQVHGERALEGLEVDVGEALHVARPEDAGAGHDAAEPAELRDRALDRRAHLGLAAHVGRQREDAGAAPGEPGDDRVEPLRVPVDEGDLGALGREPLAGRLADAARGARDQDRPFGETGHGWRGAPVGSVHRAFLGRGGGRRQVGHVMPRRCGTPCAPCFSSASPSPAAPSTRSRSSRPPAGPPAARRPLDLSISLGDVQLWAFGTRVPLDAQLLAEIDAASA